MNFVVDASVALSWCFEDEGGEYALAVLDALQESEAAAASIWPLEVANGLVVAERRGRIEPDAAARFSRLLLALPIVVDPVSRARSFEGVRAVARRRGLRAYDAAYLELASRLAAPLATLDVPLRRAAEAEGVAVFSGGGAE